MPAPGVHTEIEEFAGYLAAQLSGIRAAAHGLTDDQARTTPCRSSLSVGGLVKHATYVMQGRLTREAHGGQVPELTKAGFADFMGSFSLTRDETMASTLERFDETTATYLASVRSADPDGPAIEPPAPWDGINESTETTQRFYLMHHVEELARHAGHADIIREQIDGADSASLVAAVEGRPPNDFVQPWTPEGSGGAGG